MVSTQEFLSPNGRFYLVAVKENDIPGIRHRMLHDHELQSQVHGRKHIFL